MPHSSNQNRELKMPSANVTRRELSLGSQDSVTCSYAKNFTTETYALAPSPSTIKMIIRPRGQSVIGLPVGNYAKYDMTGFVTDIVKEGDEIIDAQGKYYEIKTVEEEWQLDSFSHRVCSLVKLPLHYDRPATSGTWHLDSGGLKTDVRYRQKLWISDHLVAGNLSKDDGSQASYLLCFANPDYHMTRVLNTKAIDLVASIDNGEAEALPLGIGYHESVPIELFAINKSGITATNLIEKGYQELRRIAETYPLGSLRKTGRMTDTSQSLGSTILFSQKCVLEYKRYAT